MKKFIRATLNKQPQLSYRPAIKSSNLLYISCLARNINESIEGIAHGTRKPAPSQFGLINLLKAGAAQLIVLHHLAFYGPMADHARALPRRDRLAEQQRAHCRASVPGDRRLPRGQVAGAVRHAGYADPLRAIWRRYAKLAPAFLAATLIAAVASAQAAHG
jgi:hypothetical protein